MRSRLICASALVLPLWLGGSMAMAELGGGGADPEQVMEQTGAGWAVDNAAGAAQVAGAPVGQPAATFSGTTAVTTTSPSFSFFPDQEMPCSLAIEGPIGCGQA